MAERRMFAKSIIDSDAFLDMPATAQLLYFHLSMRADDDGFINQPKSIMRMTGCKDDDMKLLIAKKFLIPFETGVVVIKHWKIHNYIAKDRYTETNYKEEKALLTLDENKAYTRCIQPVYKMDTQVSIGKLSIDEDNIISSAEDKQAVPAKPQKHRYGEHKNVLLTDDEVEKLKAKFGSSYTEFLDKFSNGLALKGYKYKSHYLRMLKWFKDEAPQQAGEDLIMQGMSIVPVFGGRDG